MFVQAGAAALLALLGLMVARTSATPVLPVLFLAGLLSGGAHGFLYPGLAALVTDRAPDDAPRRGGRDLQRDVPGRPDGRRLRFGYVAHAFGYGVMWSVLTSLLLVGAVLVRAASSDAPRALTGAGRGAVILAARDGQGRAEGVSTTVTGSHESR